MAGLAKNQNQARGAPALAGTGLGLPCQHRAKLSRNIPQKGSRYPCPGLEGQEPPRVLPNASHSPACPLAPVPGEHACQLVPGVTWQGRGCHSSVPVPDLPQAKINPFSQTEQQFSGTCLVSALPPADPDPSICPAWPLRPSPCSGKCVPVPSKPPGTARAAHTHTPAGCQGRAAHLARWVPGAMSCSVAAGTPQVGISKPQGSP